MGPPAGVDELIDRALAAHEGGRTS
jgi:hypothetical protein